MASWFCMHCVSTTAWFFWVGFFFLQCLPFNGSRLTFYLAVVLSGSIGVFSDWGDWWNSYALGLKKSADAPGKKCFWQEKLLSSGRKKTVVSRKKKKLLSLEREKAAVFRRKKKLLNCHEKKRIHSWPVSLILSRLQSVCSNSIEWFSIAPKKIIEAHFPFLKSFVEADFIVSAYFLSIE